METFTRTRTTNSDSSSDSYQGGPISVDKYLEENGPISVDEYLEAGSPSSPISIDAFLESALQFISYPQKDRVLSMSTATESTITESCASPPVSPPVSPPASPLPVANRPSIMSFYFSEPPQKSDSVEFFTQNIEANETKKDPEGSRYEDISDDASAETEVGSNCRSKIGNAVAKEQAIASAETEVGSNYQSKIGNTIAKEQAIASAETEVGSNCQSEIGNTAKEQEFKSEAEVGDTYDESDDSVSAESESGSNGQNKTILVQGKVVEPVTEAQEWTYEDHISEEEKRQQDRDEKFEAFEKERLAKVMKFAVAVLMLDVAAAVIAVKNHQNLIECCGNSIFSEDESVGERWNKIFFWVGILYLPVIILIEIPTLLIAQEPLFIFNPMVGFLLAMQMLYTTDVMNAYIIFGLEVLAMLGQSRVLAHMRRSPESCMHYALNYTLAAITVFMLVRLKQQGGYCIVGNRIQSVFSEQTCNVGCIDEESCFRCNSGDEFFLPNCFIPFS